MYELVVHLPDYAIPVVIGTGGRNIKSIENADAIDRAFVTEVNDRKPFQRAIVRARNITSINRAAERIQTWVKTATANEYGSDARLPMMQFEIRELDPSRIRRD